MEEMLYIFVFNYVFLGFGWDMLIREMVIVVIKLEIFFVVFNNEVSIMGL